MKDYHSLYLRCVVLFLTDASEKFRNNTFKNQGLCPNHYLSAPALSRDAILKIKKIKLEYIPDPGMYISFERGIREGIYF